MIPYLVAAPEFVPVLLPEMKLHLRVDHNDDDGLIEAQQMAAIAYLDARGGVLGRCIMPQTWAVDVTGAGPHLLPFPDASNIAAVLDGINLSVETALTSCGTAVTVAEAAPNDEVTITAQYALPTERFPAAVMLVKLIVGNWYENREATTESSMGALPMAADALISALRWRKI